MNDMNHDVVKPLHYSKSKFGSYRNRTKSMWCMMYTLYGLNVICGEIVTPILVTYTWPFTFELIGKLNFRWCCQLSSAFDCCEHEVNLQSLILNKIDIKPEWIAQQKMWIEMIEIYWEWTDDRKKKVIRPMSNITIN